MKESKISVVEAQQMSLDEYIKASGIEVPKIEKRRQHKRNHSFVPMETTDTDPSLPNASSQQWRLLDTDRPIGMAPLIPANARQRIYRRRDNSSFDDRDRPSNGVNRKNHPNFKNYSRQRNAMNMNGSNSAVAAMMTNNVISTMNQMTRMATNDSAVPMFDLIMEMWHAKKARQPKYDMSVQREIAQVQGKSLYFTADGISHVVTSDGPGVDDCKPTVATTNHSTHQRFT